MKSIHFIKVILSLVFAVYALTAHTEDIDIYSGLTINAAPNVMFVVDNPSSQNNAVGVCHYWDGTLPSEGSNALGNDQCALANIVHDLQTRADGSAVVNLGITTMAGVIFRLTPIDNNLYTGSFPVPAGTTNKDAFILAVKSLAPQTGKSGQGSQLQETWAYYTGGNGSPTGTGILSGVTYPGTNAINQCRKNYIIYLSNVKANASHAQEYNSTEQSRLIASINNAVANGTLTATQGSTLSATISPALQAGEGREWARFMKTVDINTTAEGTGTQAILTYSVATGDTAVPPAVITNEMEKYISAVAAYGGGKYYPAGNDSNVLTNSILKILNEVQAVNSVFSSSSLPVSVNTQGTYLNQIYMGMFRPDPGGNPRWAGNLKQYHFRATRDATTHQITLSLVDSLNNSALNPATGFITDSAVSYWTCGGNPSTRPCSPVADVSGGFWINDALKVTSSRGGAYDLADGELVDKGGAAQLLRLANLTNNYATSEGSSTNPRKLFTFCPSGTACNNDLTHADNAFSKTNAGITGSQFGTASRLPVSSIVRTGTSALVTTASAHGFSPGSSVTISGATQVAYNVTQNITVNDATSFTITGLPNNPPSPNTGTYQVALHNSATQTITSMALNTSTTTNANGCNSGTIPNINCNRVTVTLAGHGYTSGDRVVIAGVTPNEYNGTFTIGNVTSNTFTYQVNVIPTSPSVNAYSIALPAPTANIVTDIRKLTGDCTVTSNAHGFAIGDSITISGNSAWNGTYTVLSTGLKTNSFEINLNCNSTGSGGLVVRNNPTYSIAAGSISRSNVTASTATGIASGALTHNQTYILSYVSGTNSSEGPYAPYLSGSRSVQVTCASGTTCSTFNFPITITPSATLSYTGATAALSNTTLNISAGAMTRSAMGTTVTVTGVPANTLVTGNYVDLSPTGSVVTAEAAYLSPAAGWPITCISNLPTPCNTFTFGPIALDPATPATGAFITAYQSSTPPAKDPLVDWVRGSNNFGDEPGPGGLVTVRPSVHGDVLHSRPITVNYGGTTGVVLFYGANDGVFRAVNGNQTAAIGSVPAGGELWGLTFSDSFSKLTRQRDNSPLLDLPSTVPGIDPVPQKKDYFVDGSTGLYQVLNASGGTNTAYLYLSLRRGGNSIYSLDVTNPASPQYRWKITNAGDFSELGQTWSAPKVAFIKGYADVSGNPKPVVIFGAGYATTQDTEPAGTDSAGRGIFIVDALTGSLVWRVTYDAITACSAPGVLPAICTESGMNYSIPADITLMDSDRDGYIDRLYTGDMGGNVWRVDLQREGNSIHNSPEYWRVFKIASLGGSGTPRRKFFYPPDVIPTSSFDAVIVGSGDREHPLYANAATDKQNRIFMLKDVTGNSACLPLPSGVCGNTTIVKDDLFKAGEYSNTSPEVETTYPYSSTSLGSGSGVVNRGFYLDLRLGEKVVNAPLTVAGYTYLGTNQPSASNTCSANLGIARGYRINPFNATFTSTEYAGGGLPPSAVSGVVSVLVEGESTPSLVPFIIGGGGDPNCTGPDCASALGGGKPKINVSTKRTKTHWYQEID
jgi:type IV pilus assembly protein PilY1